jgi:predicted DCC family thiol-disulfide oxidoreductase YuxK
VARLLWFDAGGTVRGIPLQHADATLISGRPRPELQQAVHVVRADGAVFAAAAAVRETVAGFPGGRAVTLIARLPGVMPLAEAMYRWVARRWGPVD